MLKQLLAALVNLVLYGHFWIAAAALVMSMQTRFLFTGRWQWTMLDGFIAAGTMTIYALHRLVALRMQINAQERSRYRIMLRFRWHIIVYALLAVLLAAWCYWQLTPSLQWWLLVPCGIALAYVLPLLNGRRLRDLPYIKIFLIALSWAWLTVLGPVWEAGGSAWTIAVLLMALERGCFIFAITIPFDIRDMGLDAANELNTLPGVFGVRTAKWWAYVCLGMMGGAVLGNAWLGFYVWPVAGVLLASVISTVWIVQHSTAARHDYYFTGLVDGTMLIQAALVYWAASTA
jgi:4-hydroxybenzoate polyprenyltransferase